MKRGLAAVAFLALLPVCAHAVDEPADYRMEEFRAPVPDTLRGATVIGPEQAHELWEAGTAAFVDVLPQAPKPKGLPEGTIWREKKRHSIPGSIWLPNVGYGALADVNDAYFRAGLDRITEGNMSRAVVFFCLQDCWMSWNAAKRALEYGYTNVYWLPDGTDGWTFFDYPTEVVPPEPGSQ